MTAKEFYDKHFMKMLNVPEIMEAYAEQRLEEAHNMPRYKANDQTGSRQPRKGC